MPTILNDGRLATADAIAQCLFNAFAIAGALLTAIS